MIQAYLDESGTHKDAPLVVVAGWLGDRRTWKSFIKEWSKHLKKAGVPYFHAKDPRCEPLESLLVHTILKRNLLGLACTVNPSDFQNNTSDRFKSELGNAYSTCAYICAGMISKIAKEYGSDSVALVYEAGQPNGNFIYETISAIMAEPVDHRFASINFLNKEHPGAIPLQAADFLAHAIGVNKTKWIEKFLASGKLYPPVEMPPEKLQESSRKINDMLVQRRKLRRLARKKILGDED